MALPSFTGVGRLTEDPQLRFSSAGIAVASISLAFNARRFDKDRQEWVDGDVCFIRGTAYRGLAENAAETLTRGMEVVVSGRLKTEQWEDRDGEKRSRVALIVESIGPNLAWATAKVARVDRSHAGGADTPRAGVEDPWAGGGGEEPPF